ncbi:MAG: glycine zipper 2TM domain-containing protein [Herminiimonas sp.]|nr:glycine zipper 2TM domain-containing protein [Herminiimonas sp.]
MTLKRKCLAGMVAVLPLFSIALVSTHAHAQQYANTVAAPRIEGFNVDEVNNLTPGAELDFSVYGSPGGKATLRIEGAQRNLVLNEVDAGVYEGTYIIGSRDRIVARSAVTANLRVGNLVTSAVLSESLQSGVGYHSQDRGAGPLPKIERFDVRPSAELREGNDLAFTMYGTPGGKAEITIDGARGRFFLDENRRGEYSGVYSIRRADRIASNSVVTANLRVGERVTTLKLGKPLLSATAIQPVASAPRYCSNCGTVETVNVVDVKGDGSYLGTVGGGLVGALLGNQVGSGNGRTAATIAGALGGAYAGKKVEENTGRNSHFEVLVRLQNGGTQTLSFANDPGYRVGEKVRIVDGQLNRQ